MTLTVDGIAYALDYTRRRYGRTTYTWVTAVSPAGQRLDLGDPWPSITPKRTDVERDIRRVAATSTTKES